MDKNEILACRILAYQFPDLSPHKMRDMIDKALDVRPDADIVKIWAAMLDNTKDKNDEKSETITSPNTKEVIEYHYYHHYDKEWWKPYYSWTSTTIGDTPCTLITPNSHGLSAKDLYTSSISVSDNSTAGASVTYATSAQ